MRKSSGKSSCWGSCALWFSYLSWPCLIFDLFIDLGPLLAKDSLFYEMSRRQSLVNCNMYRRMSRLVFTSQGLSCFHTARTQQSEIPRIFQEILLLADQASLKHEARDGSWVKTPCRWHNKRKFHVLVRRLMLPWCWILYMSISDGMFGFHM